MDTSSSYIVDNTKLQTLILASIQTLKQNSKKCGTEEVFKLVLESLVSDIDKESFDKILEFLFKNQIVKASCYAHKICPSIPKEDQIKNIHKFQLMKYSFFKEVNSFKKQLLETSEIDPTRIQSQTDNINITSILERLIVQLQDQVSTLKNQLDRKDKVINTLLEILEKKHHEEISPSRATTNGSSVIQTSYVIQATSVKTQHDNINMNQGSSINSIKKAQNITQAITNTDIPPIFKENTKNKPDTENKGTTICRKSAEQDQSNKNPKSKRDSVVILGDSTIKHTNGWEIAKKLKPECQVFVRNFPGATTNVWLIT